ncbi:hypothetical protein VRB95_11210 [Erwinia aphidicola]|uniref:hypothetical protein n=1 Tax=Erwinia aphidicola TaxID=68334 RepID=UPI0030D1DFCA
MIWIMLYLMIAAYLFGGSEGDAESLWLRVPLCLLWLPVLLVIASSALAVRAFGEK